MIRLLAAALISLSLANAANFVHPAGWHTQSDITRIRLLLADGKEPWRSTALLLRHERYFAHGPLQPRACVAGMSDLLQHGVLRGR